MSRVVVVVLFLPIILTRYVRSIGFVIQGGGPIKTTLSDASTKSDDDDVDDDGAKDDDDDDDDDESRVVFCGCVVVRSWDDGVDDGSVLEPSPWSKRG